MHIKNQLQKSILNITLTTSLILLASLLSQAQETGSNKNKNPFPVKYRSLVDQTMLIKTVTLAPVYDNTNGIYSKPIQKLLIDLLQSDKSWGYSEIIGAEGKFIENYDINQNDVLETLTKSKAEGLLTAFITKGPRGLNAKLKLFTHDGGFILIEESMDDINAFEVAKLREQFVKMYLNLKNKLPYRGYILSRRGQDVTISLGSINGLKIGQEITLAQIIKINRHPKLKILVGVEKEIIAKAVVTKADTYLSFAQITFEKETGVVDVGAKVLPVDYISYPKPQLSAEGDVMGDEKVILNSKNNLPTTSEKIDSEATDPNTQSHRETVFDRHNSMGSATLQGVITQYTATDNLANGSTVNSSQTFAPGFYLGGRYNFYQNFFTEAGFQNNTFSLGNGLNGSTPFTLSASYSKISVHVGYDYSFSEEESDDDITFTGTLGYSQYKTTVDDSTPTAYTSTQTNTMNIQLRASMPLETEVPIAIGGQFELAFAPSYSESPVNSGKAAVNLTSFGFFVRYQLNDKFNLVGDLNINQISTVYTGTPTRSNPAGSAKIEITNQQIGFEYLF